MGYSILVCPDHFDDQLGPFSGLMLAAEAFPNLRIGTHVLDNDFRHPVIVAKEAATLDILSDGRLELGLGAGWAGSDYTASGIPLERPGMRVSRLIESVQIIKGLLSGTPVDFSGRYYAINGLEGMPKPVQQPHPPLFIGGGGERILSFAGQEADIVGLLPPTRDGTVDLSQIGLGTVAQQVEWVRRSAGERFSRLELNAFVYNVVVTDHPRDAAEEIALSFNKLGFPVGGAGTTPELVLDSTLFLVGTVDGIAEEIQMWRERFGISYVVVREADRDALGPVVRRLAGT